MKLKYFITGMLATVMLLPSCVEVDELNSNNAVGAHQLTVKGFLVNDYNGELPAVINHEAGTITVQVPYYISDTERIMGDLTQMKLEAQLPKGYTFSPSLSGIHDLNEGYRTNLLDEKGNSTSFTIVAEYVKSKEAKALSVSFDQAPRAISTVKDPENAGDHGLITVHKTTSSLDGALKNAKVKFSPWATIECESYDEATGNIDFSNLPTIKVTSQDGSVSNTYDVLISTPSLKDTGVGYISSMWGYQIYKDNEQGFVANQNTTMAIIDDYLIISNHSDPSGMIVLDRYSGNKVNVQVNASGMPADREFRAICNDDANHLVAAAFTQNNQANTKEPNTPASIIIYAWKDGITNPPTQIMSKSISEISAIASYATYEYFRVIDVRGDVFNGDAVAATHNIYAWGRPFIIQLKDGAFESAVVDANGGIGSTWSSSNCLPTTNKAPYGYFQQTSNARSIVSYIPAGTEPKRGFDFAQPTAHWWANGNVRAVDYIEFNGCFLLGVSNGNSAGAGGAQRLYVSNIGYSPTASSLAEGFIFDSREGNLNGLAGISGTGPVETGMTSAYSFSEKIVLGDNFLWNNRMMGDVIFGRSADGNAVQVYLLTPDQGLFSYEITRFDI